MGRGLSLFAETSISSRLGGLCTVPSPGVDQRSESTHGGTPQGTQGREVNRLTARVIPLLRHRPREASPERGITRERHRPREALLERGVAREGHRRVKTSPERLRASTIQNNSKGKRKGGFKAISLAPEGGYPNF